MDAPAENPEEQAETHSDRAPLYSGPSGLRLALTSVGAFCAIVMVGGVIGLLLGPSNVEVPATMATSSLGAIDVATEVAEVRAEVRTVVIDRSAIDETADGSAVDGASGWLQAALETDVLELPKAVYDRFSLRVGNSFATNIAANDKIGGEFRSVELTGLGELAPGFDLDADGTLSGTAVVCGKWSAQYALNSTNPAVGTSWIEVTVVGCDGA